MEDAKGRSTFEEIKGRGGERRRGRSRQRRQGTRARRGGAEKQWGAGNEMRLCKANGESGTGDKSSTGGARCARDSFNGGKSEEATSDARQRRLLVTHIRLLVQYCLGGCVDIAIRGWRGAGGQGSRQARPPRRGGRTASARGRHACTGSGVEAEQAGEQVALAVPHTPLALQRKEERGKQNGC